MNAIRHFDPYQPDDWQRLSLWLVGLTIIALLVFRIIGSAETAVSDLFFTPMKCEIVRIAWGGYEGASRCGEFQMAFDPVWDYVRNIGLLLPRFVALALLAWGIGLALRHHGRKPHEFMPIAVGLTSFLAGPTLLVNVIMKPGFGRPRPFKIDEFGYKHDYVLPGSFSDQCSGNCSFVSGEASGIFWLFCIIPFVPARWRVPAAAALLFVACWFSFMRVMFGRHYLSDVTIGALISLLIVALSGWFFASSLGRRTLSTLERNTVS